MLDPNPFEVLGVKPGADEQTVRAAYRRLVKSCHPDQFQDAAQQKSAQEQLILRQSIAIAFPHHLIGLCKLYCLLQLRKGVADIAVCVLKQNLRPLAL